MFLCYNERCLKETIIYKNVETIPEFIDAIRIRVDVFILEQKCPAGYDPDKLDKTASHYVAIVDNEIVASARLREDPPGAMKIENMVVKKSHRGQGIGTGLTNYLVSETKKQNPTRIWMEAQSHAIPVYERAGFKVVSTEYDLYNLGIPHVQMEYPL